MAQEALNIHFKACVFVSYKRTRGKRENYGRVSATCPVAAIVFPVTTVYLN
jgi:hypothetical protein